MAQAVSHSTSTTAHAANGRSLTDGDGRHATQRSPWRFSGRVTGPPWKLMFANLVEIHSVRQQQSFADVSRRPAQDRGCAAASESRELALPAPHIRTVEVDCGRAVVRRMRPYGLVRIRFHQASSVFLLVRKLWSRSGGQLDIGVFRCGGGRMSIGPAPTSPASKGKSVKVDSHDCRARSAVPSPPCTDFNVSTAFALSPLRR